MFTKPINYEKYKRMNNTKKNDGNTTGLHQLQVSRPVKPKFIYNPSNQIISEMANNRIENNNYNINGNLPYQYRNLRQFEKPTESRAPSNHIRPQSNQGKYNNNHNTYGYSNINNRRIPMDRQSIDANKREPEHKYIISNQRISNKIKSPETIQDRKPYNSYMQNKDIVNVPKESKTKPLNQKIKEQQRGYSSGNQRPKKSPQDQKESHIRNFEVETPIKNKLQNETNSSIKKESSIKFESSSKKGKTDKNFHQKDKIVKKKLDLNAKSTKEGKQPPKASETCCLRGKPLINVIDKQSSQQALNPNEFSNKKSNNLLEESNDVVEIKKFNENELNIWKNENSGLKKELKKLSDEKKNNEQMLRNFIKSNTAKDKLIGELKKQLESQKKYFESGKNSLNEQISKLNKQLEEKIEELQEKDNEIEQLKNNNKKLKNLNEEDNEEMELTKKLQIKEKIISSKDSEISELKSKLNEASILNQKLKLEKEKIKKNNINNEDLQKGITKREKEIELKFNGLKEREKQIKNKENEINERILFIEDTERALESQRKRLDSEKKNMTDNYQSLQKEIENLNKQKMQLENQIQAMNQQIKSFNPNNLNNNNMNSNFMDMNMNNNMNNMNMNNNMNNMNMKNSMNSNMKVKNSLNSNINSVNTNAVLNNMNPNNMIYNMNYNLMNNMNNMMGNNMMQNMNMNRNMSANNNMNMNNINNNMNIINNSINKNGQINNNKKKQKDPKPLTFYEKPTLIGLQNIGATCFMNATLQCLSQTEDLTNYFLDEKRSGKKIKDNNIAVKNKNDLQLTPVYLELVKKLWDKNNFKGYFEPKRFMKTVEEMNQLFKLGQAGDSKDFIIFVLEQFHNELKKVVNNDNMNDSVNVNQYIQKEAFKFFIEDFMKQTSIISDIFYGILETNNVCLYCKNKYLSQGKPYPICYNYQVFNCLIFPLEEVRKMKNGNNMMNNMIMSQNNAVTLEECFTYNQKTDFFTGENKNHCNICKQLWDSLYTSKIYSAPNVLVLILNRGKNNVFNVKLNFTEIIDITQFVSVKIERMLYKLVGVITHYGESGRNAHFLAFCRSPINDKWYRYNDAVVTDVKNFQKDVIDFGTPYILFYKKAN